MYGAGFEDGVDQDAGRDGEEDRKDDMMRTNNYEPWDYEGESGDPELDDLHERRGPTRSIIVKATPDDPKGEESQGSLPTKSGRVATEI
jgi:hypothetical protein